MRVPRWLAGWGAAALAILCGTASWGFWQGSGGADTPVGWAGASAYVGQVQTHLVEHQGLLYQERVVQEAERSAAVDRRESSLNEGASWLEMAGYPDAAQAVRRYLSEARAARTGNRAQAEAALAGPVHGAAGEALSTLMAVQDQITSSEAGAAGSAALAAAGRQRQVAVLFLALSVALGAVALAGALSGERAEPGPSAPAPAGVPTEAVAGVARRARQGRAVAAELAAAGTDAAREAGEVAQGLACISAAGRRQAEEMVRVAEAAVRLQQSVAQTAADLQQRHEAGALAKERVEAITGSAAALAERAVEAAASADELRKQVGATAAALGGALKPVEQLLTGTGETATSLEELARRAIHVEGAVAAIKGIAVQTNMLALNAAIEAARAGERGRGFAVVADSVRELAGKAQQHAKEIEARVTGIGELARRSASEVERQRHLAETSAQAVQEAQAALADLLIGDDVGTRASLEQAAMALEQGWRDLCRSLGEEAAAKAPAAGLESAMRELREETGLLALGANEGNIALEEARRTAEAVRTSTVRLADKASEVERESGGLVREISAILHQQGNGSSGN